MATFELASVASDGTRTNEDSTDVAISGDGRYVVFTTAANNLVSGDENQTRDLYLRDLVAGTTTRIAQGEQFTDHDASISADGRYIVYDSSSSGGDSTDDAVFLYDRVAGTTANLTAAGTGAELIAGDDASISADGRYVAFIASLPDGDTLTHDPQVFLYDRVAGSLQAITDEGNPDAQGDFSPGAPVVSADGRFVAYHLKLSGEQDGWGIYVYDRVSGGTEEISVGNGPGNALWPAISGDGRYVAFQSNDTLVDGDTSNAPDDDYDIFLFDRETDTIQRITDDTLDSVHPELSGDGRYLTFLTEQTFSSADNDIYRDAYRYDLADGSFELISSAPISENQVFSPLAISGDGSKVAFLTGGQYTQDDFNDIDVIIADFLQAQRKLTSNVDGGQFDDIVYRSVSNGQVIFQDMDAGAPQGFDAVTGPLTDAWVAVGTGDVTGDGKADVFVWNSESGQVFIAAPDASGAPIWSVLANGINGDFSALGTTDIDGDGATDLLVHQASTGSIFWQDGATAAWDIVGVNLGAAWSYQGAGDVNHDGYADVAIRHTSGQVAIANMADGVNSGYIDIGNISGFAVRAIADVSGDGFADVVVQSEADGQTLWRDLSGDGPAWNIATDAMGTDWVLQRAADVDGDSSADLIFQHATSGLTIYRAMDDGVGTGWGNVSTSLGGEWVVV